jgi:sugar O-acyltransferase (sialic acid O-acetyltransferase NeuD family)
MLDTIVLIGGGGHCKACIDVLETAHFTIVGILEKDPAELQVLNYPVIGNDDIIEELIEKKYRFLITIGQIKNALPRIRLYDKIKQSQGKLETVISPFSLVSKYSSVGEGTIIMHQALINADTRIGDNCIINTKALIEHDCIIGDHTHISTAAIVNGGCIIGNRVFVGSNSVLAQGVHIADDVIIGSGSVIINNVDEPGTYAGSPVRKIKP